MFLITVDSHFPKEAMKKKHIFNDYWNVCISLEKNPKSWYKYIFEN